MLRKLIQENDMKRCVNCLAHHKKHDKRSEPWSSTPGRPTTCQLQGKGVGQLCLVKLYLGKGMTQVPKFSLPTRKAVGDERIHVPTL
jgi:hypothetical protein